MALTPSGSPAWVRTNDHTAYGGDVNKANYQSQGSVNPRTDLTAENICRLAADLAAIARTAPLARLAYTCNDAAPAAPTITSSGSMWAQDPTPTRNGNGDVTFTWAASYTDPYGVSGNVNIIGAKATLVGTTASEIPVELVDAHTVRVRAFDTAGAAISDAKVALVIY